MAVGHKLGAASVRGLLHRRRLAASRPGMRDDGAVVALVVEGGGMRGVVAGGMVSALEHLGMLDCFDILCGTSAGAFACAYFGAGQAALGTRVYAEDLCDRRFIALHRGASFRPVMDVDYLVDEVSVTVKTLDLGALLSRSARLIVVATDVVTGLPYLLDGFADGAALRQALRASCRVPLVAGAPVNINGHRLVDGAIAAALPLMAAVEAGATHILALTTRALTAPDGQRGNWRDAVIAHLLRRSLGAPLVNAFLGRNTGYASARSALRAGLVRMDGKAAVSIMGVGPDAGISIDQLCQNARLLGQAARGGFEAMIACIDSGDANTVDENAAVFCSARLSLGSSSSARPS